MTKYIYKGRSSVPRTSNAPQRTLNGGTPTVIVYLSAWCLVGRNTDAVQGREAASTVTTWRHRTIVWREITKRDAPTSLRV
jgi:hypothetical protein